MPTAVAYLRRSRVDTRRPGTLSHEQQLERIRAEAARHGDTDLVIVEDWGKSGREEKTHLRAGFAELERMVEKGEATAIYAYDLSRLGRSLVTVHRLTKRCAELGIPVRCADGFSPDVSNAQGRMVLNILTAIGQFYAESTQERMQSLTMMRRQRGDRIGPAPYGFRVRGGKLEPDPTEDVARLLDAYRRAGSVQAAVRLLNAEGIPTRRGGRWQPSTLAQVLEVAGAITRRPKAGRPATRTFLLSGLLRCHCGATLTGRYVNRGAHVGYECKRARLDPSHGRPSSISEALVAPFVRDRVDGLDWGGDHAEMPAPAVDRDALEARRRRVVDNYEDGVIDRAERNEKLAAIDAQITAASRSAVVAELPAAIDWTWPVEDVNRLLRLLVDRVELGPYLRPMADGVVWRGRIAEWAS